MRQDNSEIKVDITNILQDIYDSEINIAISWFWDGRIDVTIGDSVNGIEDENNFDTIESAMIWLINSIIKLHPDSDFSKKWGGYQVKIIQHDEEELIIDNVFEIEQHMGSKVSMTDACGGYSGKCQTCIRDRKEGCGKIFITDFTMQEQGLSIRTLTRIYFFGGDIEYEVLPDDPQ